MTTVRRKFTVVNAAPIRWLVALSLAAQLAAAQHAKVLILRNRMPTGITVVPATTYTGTTPVYWQPAGGQHVIPRYANGVTHPAGQLLGWGPTSVVQGTSSTSSQTVKAVVITQDYGVIKSQWLSGTNGHPEYAAAVLQPALVDLTIAGYDSDSNGYSSPGQVSDDPAIYNKINGTISGATNAMPIVITSATHSLATGAAVMISGVQGNTAANGGPWTITLVDPDGVMGPLTILDGFSLSGSNGTASGTYVAGTGVWTSDYWQDLYHGALVDGSGARIERVNFRSIPGTACVLTHWVNSRGGRSHPLDLETPFIDKCDATRCFRGFDIAGIDVKIGMGTLTGSGLRDYGVKFSAGATQIGGALHFFGVGNGGGGNPGAAVWFASSAGLCWGGPIYAESSRIGILIESGHNQLENIFSHSCPFGNIKITGSVNHLTNVTVLVQDGTTETYGAEGIRVENQNTMLTTGTVRGYNGMAPVAMPSGEIGIRVVGSGANRLVLRDFYFNGTGGSSAPLISVEGELTDSVIEATCLDAGTFLDLYTNTGGGLTDRLGTGNKIWLTTSSTGAGVTKKVNLDPTGWDKNTNLIVVDGVRVLGPITGATNVNPIVITSDGHELRDGELVAIDDIQGNTNANGSYYVDVQSVNTFALFTNETLTTGRAGSGSYTANTGYFGKRFNSVDVAGN